MDRDLPQLEFLVEPFAVGAPLFEPSREKKQAAVRILDDRGAFLLCKAVDHVAGAMGVSRITIYNYLNSEQTD